MSIIERKHKDMKCEKTGHVHHRSDAEVLRQRIPGWVLWRERVSVVLKGGGESWAVVRGEVSVACCCGKETEGTLAGALDPLLYKYLRPGPYCPQPEVKYFTPGRAEA